MKQSVFKRESWSSQYSRESVKKSVFMRESLSSQYSKECVK